MKKAINLKFMALSALLMLGNVFAFAQPDPQLNQAVGTTLADNVVTYRVNNATPITVEGEKAYSVTITGLDADGLEALKGTNPTIALQVPITFREKLGEQYYRFYVTEIKEGALGQSFYGYTEISKLEFIAEPGGSPTPLVPYSEATNKFTVGSKAFYGCSSMTELEFTPNCSAIGQYAFQNTAITSFKIPQACASIGQYAFYNCKSLLTITVESGNEALTTIGNYVFGNSAINTIDLTNATKLKKLEAKPFMYSLSEVNDVLATITLPASLETIDATVFQNCTFLQQVNGLQATGVTEIQDASFLNCRNLAQLDLPNANINKAPFVGCVKLATLTFPDGYSKTVGVGLDASQNLYGTFDIADANYSENDQKALKTLTFKKDATAKGFFGTIAEHAFKGSLALEKVEFLSAIRGGATISASAFEDVTTLATVTFDGGFNTLVSGTTDAAIAIADAAFKNTGITALDFKTITLTGTTNAALTISNNAFSDCAKLAKVTFGDITVNNQGNFSIIGKAFTQNPLLKDVIFGQQKYTDNGNFWIYDNAFAEDNVALENVSFGKIINSTAEKSGTFYIGYDANLGAYATYGDDAIRVFGDGEHLKTVTFDDAEAGLGISQLAFASTGLTSVKFGNIKAAKNKQSGFVICKDAFLGGAAAGKTVEFKNIEDNGTGKLGFAILKDAFAAESLTSVTFGNVSATTVTIEEGAFAGKSLETVTIGNISASANDASTFAVRANAFNGGEVNAKTVTIGEIKDSAKELTVDFGESAFAGDKLTTVSIAEKSAADATKVGTIAAKTVLVQATAFQGKSLETVTLGNITAGVAASTFTVNANAFQGGEVENKAVVIGNITDNGTKALTATIGENAFAGQMLNSVTIGDMTASSIAISGAKAFANQNEVDAMTENVTVGKLAAGLVITGEKVFQGPVADGSELHVTIAEIAGAATIPAKTFVAPAKGKASYTVKGDVAAGSAANIAAEAFRGSMENVVTPVNNTTSVKIQGDYKDNFKKATFTNVNDVEVGVDKDGKAKTVSGIYPKAFSGAKKVTLGNCIANVIGNSADANSIEEITFLGSVKNSNSIQDFASPNVRLINFKNVENKDVKVAAGAVAAGAFKAAADDAAAKGENITVIYREAQTHDEAVNIFARNAFVKSDFDYSVATDAEKAAAEANVVTLYTTTWLKANIFEAADNDQADLNGEKKYVWRLGYSESDVAPGDAIVAKVAKPEGYTSSYGKLFIPKGVGMKYKIKSEYDGSKNQVQIYYGQIDNSNSKIYMYQLPIINDFFWIDATDANQQFVIRTNKEDVTEITALPVEKDDADEALAIEENDNFYYFDATLAAQNQLRYAPAKVVNQELRNNAEFKDRAVWMMANPKTYGFGFTQINKKSDVNGTPRYMPAGSLYICGKLGSDVISAAPELEVIFVDEVDDANLTGIENVKTAEQNNDAIYNLQGVRVNKAQKGIFIMNGKKFVVK